MQQDITESGEPRRLSVFVVEDDALIALDIEMILEDAGYAVLGTASSVQKALSFLEEARPDVALLDVNLRGEMVFPVAQRLRSLQIPFALASANSTFGDHEGSEVLQHAENIGKPVSERRLISALERAVQPG